MSEFEKKRKLTLQFKNNFNHQNIPEANFTAHEGKHSIPQQINTFA